LLELPRQGGNLFGAGTFTDPQGVAATIQAATTSAVFKIEAWTGPATTYCQCRCDPAAIFTLGPSYLTILLLFRHHTTDLVNMPAIILTRLPEPSTYALVGFGVALFWICIAGFREKN